MNDVIGKLCDYMKICGDVYMMMFINWWCLYIWWFYLMNWWW